ncbi:MAG TPA: GFA family protein [Bauldia sp.]|nr:GFA family protein [Bauldia sp.]
MKLPSFPIEGGCQCRAVRYRITAPPLTVYNCYCKDCQRAGASTHTISMPVKRETFEVLSGEVMTYDRSADSGRVVRMCGCAHCGTKMWNEPLASSGLIVVKSGTLDDQNWAAPVGSIWTGSRPPWVEIDETQVNFAGQPPDRQPLYDAWARMLAQG